MIPAPWSFDYDPCKRQDFFTGETYGQDFPIYNFDGNKDPKSYFCRVKFSPSIPLAEAHDMAKLMTAAPAMFEALREIAERGPVDGYSSASALRLRLVATQTIAREALAKATGDNRP